MALLKSWKNPTCSCTQYRRGLNCEGGGCIGLSADPAVCLCLFVRAELLSVYERVILSDLEYSDTHNLDQALWKNAFYQVIEKFRQLLKDPASETGHQIRAMLLTLLDEVLSVCVSVCVCVRVHCDCMCF